MLNFLRKLLDTPERSGRRLYGDAVAVIRADQKNCSVDTLRHAAGLVSEELAKFDTRLTANPGDHDGFTYEVRQKHHNARQRRDYASLTAMTLVLIYLRAKKLGEPGRAAMAVVDEFIANPPGQPD